MARPNVLFLISHDTGRMLQSYGYEVETPHLEALAHESVLFDEYYCAAPQCSPSRGSILTGLYPHNNGLIGLAHLGFCISPGVATLPAVFASAGYETTLIGLSHETINVAPPIEDRVFSSTYELGYERVIPVEGDRAPRVADAAISYLAEQRDAERPFYASVGFFETHRDFDEYELVADDPAQVQVPPFLDDTPGVRHDLAQYNGSAKVLDRAVGRILEALEAYGLKENTIVLYTTDHGVAFPNAKGTLKRAGLETALMISAPGHREGSRNNDLLCNIDLMPTLLELAGIEAPEDIDGTSFAAAVTDGACCARESFFTELTWHDAYHPMRGIRTKDYCYIMNLEDGPKVYVTVDAHLSASGRDMSPRLEVPNEPEELYDLTNDPQERVNLADDPAYREVLERLRGRVLAWMAETNDPVLAGPVAGTPSSRWAHEIAEGRAYPGRAAYYARIARDY
ncbi:MAG TPA: sulfatase [Candidatus Coprousia avicola]|nr:sulfatase [Candidatus Coprousia avicola]